MVDNDKSAVYRRAVDWLYQFEVLKPQAREVNNALFWHFLLCSGNSSAETRKCKAAAASRAATEAGQLDIKEALAHNNNNKQQQQQQQHMSTTNKQIKKVTATTST